MPTMVRLLILAGMVCLFAFAGRVIALAAFVQFVLNAERNAAENAYKANIMQAAGIIAGGLVGVVMCHFVFRRGTKR